MGHLGWLYKLNLHARHQHCTYEAQKDFYKFIFGLSQGGALSVCESIFSCPFRCPRGVVEAFLLVVLHVPVRSITSCLILVILMSRVLGLMLLKIYIVQFQCRCRSPKKLVSRRMRTPSSALPSASSCNPGVVLSHPSAFDSSPSYLGSSPVNVSYAAAVTGDRPSLNREFKIKDYG